MAQCIQSHIVCMRRKPGSGTKTTEATCAGAILPLQPSPSNHRRVRQSPGNLRALQVVWQQQLPSRAPSRPPLAPSSKNSRRSVTKQQKMISSRGCRCRRGCACRPHVHSTSRSKRQQPPPAFLTMPVSPPCGVHWYVECSFAPPQCRVAAASGRHHRRMQARLLLIPITKRGA